MKEASRNSIQLQPPKFEVKDKQKLLEDIAARVTSPILILRVLNSCYNLNKGTQLKINCLGILDDNDVVKSERRDGVVYFGYTPEDVVDKSIDYSIPVAKTTVEKSDQANM
jgi:hypothetical protein